jgi:ATP-dependent protease ClpP protease subunit
MIVSDWLAERETSLLRAILASIVAAGVLTLAPFARADVAAKWMNQPDTKTLIEIRGGITWADTKRVDAVIRQSVVKPGLPFELEVWLDSKGGDVEAAMAMGRLIRKRTTQVLVMRGGAGGDAICVSACVLVLAAGSQRIALGNHVGIHRPFSTTSVSPVKDVRANYAALATKMKAYLEEMGMPGRLYEEMMRIEPQYVRWLPTNECTELGLCFGTDAAYGDFQDSREAASRGISKQEYLRRKALAAQECTINPARFAEASYNETINTLIKYGDCNKRVIDTGNP